MLSIIPGNGFGAQPIPLFFTTHPGAAVASAGALPVADHGGMLATAALSAGLAPPTMMSPGAYAAAVG